MDYKTTKNFRMTYIKTTAHIQERKSYEECKNLNYSEQEIRSKNAAVIGAMTNREFQVL